MGTYLPTTENIASKTLPSGKSPQADVFQIWATPTSGTYAGQTVCVWRITSEGNCVGGIQALPITVSGNVLVTNANPNVFLAGGPESLTLTLQTVGQASVYNNFYIWNQPRANGAAATVVAQTGTINGLASYSIPLGQAVLFQYNGSSNFTATVENQD